MTYNTSNLDHGCTYNICKELQCNHLFSPSLSKILNLLHEWQNYKDCYFKHVCGKMKYLSIKDMVPTYPI